MILNSLYRHTQDLVTDYQFEHQKSFNIAEEDTNLETMREYPHVICVNFRGYYS